MTKKPTYAESLRKDRELYLLQRNKLARLAFDLIDRIGAQGQELAIRDFREYVRDIGIERD